MAILKTLINPLRKWANFNCCNYLFHMTHIDNLQSIFEKGLLSHNAARNITKQDISLATVQGRRDWLEPIYHRPIHDYVPLYFNASNPMLFCRKDIQESICILKISKDVMTKEGVLFTDGNAAVHTTSTYEHATTFYSDLKDLDKLNWECIYDLYWNDYDDGKRIRCAEVLVPDQIETMYIKSIYVYPHTMNNSVLARKIDFIHNKYNIETITDNKYVYFFKTNKTNTKKEDNDDDLPF